VTFSAEKTHHIKVFQIAIAQMVVWAYQNLSLLVGCVFIVIYSKI
jgi:hypothetical protein